MNYRILLVDDEPDIIEFLGYNLRKEGYEVFTATNGKEAVIKAMETIPHLILMDVMMPEMDGFEACRIIRSHPELSDTMVAFLTARGEDNSQISGFDAGGDDYISKPVKINVLVSRIKALLKRIESDDNDQKGSLKIDMERHLVINNGNEIILPRKEFNLLALLYSKPGKVFLREEIYEKIWGNDVIVGDRTIDVHIRKLREKIGDKHIITLKGVGYKYEA